MLPRTEIATTSARHALNPSGCVNIIALEDGVRAFVTVDVMVSRVGLLKEWHAANSLKL